MADDKNLKDEHLSDEELDGVAGGEFMYKSASPEEDAALARKLASHGTAPLSQKLAPPDAALFAPPDAENKYRIVYLK